MKKVKNNIRKEGMEEVIENSFKKYYLVIITTFLMHHIRGRQSAN